VCVSQDIEALFPQFVGVVVDEVAVDGDSVRFRVRAKGSDAACSGCGDRSSCVHARYRRRLADVPVGGRRAEVVVAVRRFKCGNPHCARSTFSEQIPGLTTLFARRTPALTGALSRIALALAGRPGSRLAGALAMPCCRDVLIRLIRARPLPGAGRVQVLGIDLCRHHSYADRRV
jgi:transposase IS204/IS1001/IS1096/IS1165 family protein